MVQNLVKIAHRQFLISHCTACTLKFFKALFQNKLVASIALTPALSEGIYELLMIAKSLETSQLLIITVASFKSSYPDSVGVKT